MESIFILTLSLERDTMNRKRELTFLGYGVAHLTTHVGCSATFHVTASDHVGIVINHRI